MHQPVDEPANDRETLVPITEDWYVHGPLGKQKRQDQPHVPRGSNFRRLLKSLRRSMALPWPGNDKGAE